MTEWTESPFLPIDVSFTQGPDYRNLYQSLETMRRILINAKPVIRSEMMDRCFETGRHDLFACQLYLQKFYPIKEVIPVPYVKEWDE